MSDADVEGGVEQLSQFASDLTQYAKLRVWKRPLLLSRNEVFASASV
jgi:hypothetical protein